MKEILEVVAFVHQHNIVHRDIKPQNLMRRRRDNKIVLIDFGSIKKIGILGLNEQCQPNVNIAIGTPGYMPKEQCRGRPQLSSDVYAIGMIGIQALTGLKPEELPKNPKTGEAIWRERVKVSKAFADVLEQMISPHLSERYRSAAEALQALLAIRESSTLQLVPSGKNIDYLLPYRKSILVLAVSLGATTSLVVIVLFYIFLQTNALILDKPIESKSFLENSLHQIVK